MADTDSKTTPWWFRDSVPALISVVILVVTISLISLTFRDARNSSIGTQEEIKAKVEAYGREKDILSLALALLGTVTGYYLGRVPAEKAADNARSDADKARDRGDQAEQKAADAQAQATTLTLQRQQAKNRISEIMNGLAADRNAAEMTEDAAASARPADFASVQRELGSVRDQL